MKGPSAFFSFFVVAPAVVADSCEDHLAARSCQTAGCIANRFSDIKAWCVNGVETQATWPRGLGCIGPPSFGQCEEVNKIESGAPVTRKRGFSGFLGDFTCEDAAVLGLDDSWHYTWMTAPSQRNKCGSQKISSEFVPMINGINQAAKKLTDQIKSQWSAANAHFLLGYNEPDYGNGHNHPHMATPAAAAADWPAVQQVAAMFDPPLQLVAPGVSSGAESGGTDAWDADGRSTWLDEFLGNCTHVVKECDPSLIKYIAMHDYQGDVQKLERRISGMAKLYDRKVWITEIAITKYGSPPNRERQNAFLKEVLPYLDSSEDVFRYVWFTARNAPNKQNGGSNLLLLNGSTVLTSTGYIYKNHGIDSLEVV